MLMPKYYAQSYAGIMWTTLPELAANPVQVKNPGQPFSRQTPVSVFMSPLSDPDQPFLPGNPIRYQG